MRRRTECYWHSGLRLQIAERFFSRQDAFASVLFFHPTIYFIYFGIVAILPPVHRPAASVALGAVLYVAIDALWTRLRAREAPA